MFIGHLTGLCDLAWPFQTDSFKNCISVKVTCVALAFNVKSHPLIIIYVVLLSLGVIITLWLKKLPLWNWGDGIVAFWLLSHNCLISIFSLLGEEKQPSTATAEEISISPLPPSPEAWTEILLSMRVVTLEQIVERGCRVYMWRSSKWSACCSWRAGEVVLRGAFQPPEFYDSVISQRYTIIPSLVGNTEISWHFNLA